MKNLLDDVPSFPIPQLPPPPSKSRAQNRANPQTEDQANRQTKDQAKDSAIPDPMLLRNQRANNQPISRGIDPITLQGVGPKASTPERKQRVAVTQLGGI